MFHANFMHYTESDDQKLGGGQYIAGPQPQSWGTCLSCLPRSPWLLRLWLAAAVCALVLPPVAPDEMLVYTRDSIIML